MYYDIANYELIHSFVLFCFFLMTIFMFLLFNYFFCYFTSALWRHTRLFKATHLLGALDMTTSGLKAKIHSRVSSLFPPVVDLGAMLIDTPRAWCIFSMLQTPK